MVNGILVAISYLSDGTTLSWAVPYYYFDGDTDLIVQAVDVNGVTSNLLLNTDYTTTGTQDTYGAFPNGGSVVFQPGRVPIAGQTIVITRKTRPVQPDTYPDNNPFPATINEHDLDRLTLIAQELGATGFLGVLPGPPASGNLGDWFILRPFLVGGAFGMCCTTTGTPGVWSPFGMISL